MINLVATTRCFLSYLPNSATFFVKFFFDLQQVQVTRRSLHRLPVVSSRDVKDGNLWLGWTYRVLGLNEGSWKKRKHLEKGWHSCFAQNTKSATTVQYTKSATTVQNPKSVTAVQSPKSAASVQNTKSITSVQNAKSATCVQNTKSATSVQNINRATSVQNTKSATCVQSIKSGTSVQNTKSATNV